VLAELLLRGETFGVRGKIAPEVSPAELATRQWQVGVGPPAISGHDRLGVGEQFSGVMLVAVGRDL
jgi:hypothetical protein